MDNNIKIENYFMDQVNYFTNCIIRLENEIIEDTKRLTEMRPTFIKQLANKIQELGELKEKLELIQGYSNSIKRFNKKEIIIKLEDHLEKLENMFDTDEFTESEINEYVASLELEENFENAIEVIPATRKDFRKGIIATIITK